MTRGRPSPYPVYRDAEGVRRKHCPHCGQERNIDAGEFSVRDNPHGTGTQYCYICKPCRAALSRERRQRDPDDARERDRLYKRNRRRQYGRYA